MMLEPACAPESIYGADPALNPQEETKKKLNSKPGWSSTSWQALSPFRRRGPRQPSQRMLDLAFLFVERLRTGAQGGEPAQAIGERDEGRGLALRRVEWVEGAVGFGRPLET